MKYLSNYIDEATSEALKESGAFFAFSDKQFKEKEKEGVKYVSMDMGLICPENLADKLAEKLNNIAKQGIETDIKENGKNGIIKRELANHEAYYTGDIASTIDALAGYNFIKEDILKVFRAEQSKNLDW